MRSSNKLTSVYIIPFLKKFTILRGLFYVFAFAFLVITLIFFFEGHLDRAVMFFPGLGLTNLLISIVLMGSTWLLIGNKYPVEFILNDKGVGYRGLCKRFEKIQKHTRMAGIAINKATITGLSLLTTYSDSFLIAWKNVNGVECEPNKYIVTVKQNALKQFELYCTPDNYPKAEAVVLYHFLQVESFMVSLHQMH